MSNTQIRKTARGTALALATVLAALAAPAGAWAQQAEPLDEARVVSSQPIVEAGRTVGYTVTYEFAGRRYTTRTDSPPGPTLPVQVTPYGAGTYAVTPPPAVAGTPLPPEAGAVPPWHGVTPEPGVVVSSDGSMSGGPPGGVVYGTAPVYAAPPVIVAPPVVVAPPYPYRSWGPAYYGPPIGLSIGVGGGWRHGSWGVRAGW